MTYKLYSLQKIYLTKFHRGRAKFWDLITNNIEIVFSNEMNSSRKPTIIYANQTTINKGHTVKFRAWQTQSFVRGLWQVLLSKLLRWQNMRMAWKEGTSLHYSWDLCYHWFQGWCGPGCSTGRKNSNFNMFYYLGVRIEPA